MKRVAILGGGMAGLTAAWRLSEAECRDDVEVTVYQRGWRLGGKGASSRGEHGRIEEHGLHVWLGYYDNAFRLIRDVYAELDRPRTDPHCPIRTFDQAFAASERVGIEDQSDEGWSHWVATFRTNTSLPGTSDRAGGSSSVARFFSRGLALLVDFSASLNESDRRPEPAPVISGSPDARPGPSRAFGTLDQLLRQASILTVVGATEVFRLAERAGGDRLSRATAMHRLQQLGRRLGAATEQSPTLRRSQDLANLVLTCLQGTVRDDLMSNPAGFAAVDHLDFRAWLQRHGASPRTLDSALIRGMYDLVFAYEDGDTARPRFSAGLGLLLANRLFFDYQGSIFWHMRAGMGDVVFAPLYAALRRRGVRFELFSRLDALHLSADRSSIAAVTIGRQATLAPGIECYEPLVSVEGLPCFPAQARADQLTAPAASDLESHWSDRSTERPVTLQRGTDFDAVVLATSIGMIPHVGQEILAHSARWRAMVAEVATVPTQSLQLWLRSSETALGWPYPGATVSGYRPPFDTYASMSHLIERESWPSQDPVRGIAYFCGVLDKTAEHDPVAASELVGRHAEDFLRSEACHFWPAGVGPDGDLDPDLLRSTYHRANVDPSDQYVQSLPGSGASRLQADESGYDNLFLAGDWVNCGLNAGCIEAAVMAGHQAANAVLGRPLTYGLLGEWYGLRT